MLLPITLKPKNLYIFVNGILSDPGLATAWTDRACTWIQENCDNSWAEKFEYLSGIFLRRLTQARHACDLMQLLNSYLEDNKRWNIHLVGHSNGCDLIIRSLNSYNGCYGCQPTIQSLHLVAAACEADFERNLLNNSLAFGCLHSLHTYEGGKDKALAWAKLTRWLTLGLAGYGDLGLAGPSQVRDNVRGLIHRHREPTFGHSTWFDAEHFESTMRLIVGSPQEKHY